IAPSRRRSYDVQVIEVQRGVEKHREAAVRFVPPHGIVGEHHDVTFAYGHIKHGRFPSQFRTAREHAADQQILFIGEAQDDARTHLRRRLLGRELLAELRRYAVFAGRRSWRSHWFTPLNNIRIVQSASPTRTPLSLAAASSAGAGAATAAAAAEPAKPAAANLQQWRLVEVDGQFLVITVSNRTLTVGEGGVHNRTPRLQGARILNRNALRNAEINRDRGVGADGDKQTAPLDELLQVGYANNPHTAADISCRIGRLAHIRRHVRFLPRNGRFGIAAFWDAAHQ